MSRSLSTLLENVKVNGPHLRDAAQRGNLAVLKSMLGPAWRGLIKQEAKGSGQSSLMVAHEAHFDWQYTRDRPEMAKLYEAAKTSQWNASTDIDWSIDVDPDNPERALLPDSYVPVAGTPIWEGLSRKEKNKQLHAITSWMLSQFLHGEQGALFAACQVTTAVPWLDGKLYGSTQVVDEGRHVEVFHGYLTRKLEKLYEINDNLYVIVDALMTDSRWDVKFLGMQIMIEGLALGAFGTLRQMTREPLLKNILKMVITDEARHVHYGVLSIQEFIQTGISERERREREDWALEVAVLLRNRFLAHEFYDEFYAHAMTRKEWDALVQQSQMMQLFRKTMFKRIIPNLKRIGLLSDRVRPYYEQYGMLAYEHGRAAPELSAQDLLDDAA
ncbi:MAG TPA: ferritin-like domain-containing protein [Kofleriaceae bacterium]|nr:ferritin-like domain-containing protein [Kofleriaceae bacterium]